MGYEYLALMVAFVLVVFILARLVMGARRRLGIAGAWLVILLEAAAVGALVWAIARYMPGIGASWLGEQLILAILGLALVVIIGGGLIMALGRR